MNKFKEYFYRLPETYQEGLIELAQTELDLQDKEKEEKEKKNSEALAKSSSILTNQKALDIRDRLRNKLLKKKGLIK